MAIHSLQDFCHWLAATPLSHTLQAVGWMVPAVQTIHLLSVAVLLGSVLMINLRLLGWCWQDQPVAAVGRRFLPFIWWPLAVLLTSGALLIAAEPARALQNPVFILKMTLLLAAAGMTLGCQIPLRRDPRYWELSAARRRGARLIAAASLPLWVGIVFAGRWIAYVQSG